MLNKKKEDYIMWVLKLESIKIPLYNSHKGLLEAHRNKGEDNYTFMLDSYVVDPDAQKELSKLYGVN